MKHSQKEEKEESKSSQDSFSATFPVSFGDKAVPQTSVYLGRGKMPLGGYYQCIGSG